MKKALGQTVRDLKRGVNKKVLKVNGLERKVLDSTSNESGVPMALILLKLLKLQKITEFQMIMGALWKRLSDTGKNWRHVYKALIVLEYLVANGSERVIDEIKEHAHQISILSEFQYVDSSGRDQGSNVRRKSQSLVFLVTDKERVQEVRQKASANRDKFAKPSGYSSPGEYGDRYNEENQTGYGKDDRYSRYGDSTSRDGDRSDRESEARYSRDGSVDDEHQGKERNTSADRDGSHADDDGYSSSRGSGVRTEDYSQDGRNDNRRFHEKNPGDPPSYEEVSEGRTSVHSERSGDAPVTVPRPASPPAASSTTHSNTKNGTLESPVTNDQDNYEEFNPRGSAPAPAVISTGAEVDLLGSESFFPDNAAHIPTSATASGVGALMDSGSGANFSATFSGFDKTFEDPFGDTPFKATPSTDSCPTQAQIPPASQSTMNQGLELVPAQSFAPQTDALSTFDYGTPFGDVLYTPSASPHDQFSAANTQMVPSGYRDQETDILAGILPPSGFVASPSAASMETSQASPVQSFPSNDAFGGYHQQTGAMPSMTSHMADQSPSRQNATMNNDFFTHQGFTPSSQPFMDSQLAAHSHNQPNGVDFGGDFFQQLGSSMPTSMPHNGHTEQYSHKYGGSPQQTGSNMQATSSIAPGSPFGGNTQHNANSAFSQQQTFPPSMSPVASQSQKPDSLNYNAGYFHHSASTVPLPSHVAPDPNFLRDSVVGPQVQNGQSPPSSSDAFFHQQYTSTASRVTHMATGFSHSSTGQQTGSGFLQLEGPSQRNPNLNTQQSGSPQITPQEQSHRLQPESAPLGTSHTGPGFSYAPNSPQNTSGFFQQPASSFGNSHSNVQQPNSMLMAPPDINGQNPQQYNGGFHHQRPTSTAYGAPLMAPASSYPSHTQQNNRGFFQQQGFSVGNPSVNPLGHTALTSQNYNDGFPHQKQESQVVPGQSPIGQYNGGNFLPSSGSSQISPHNVVTGIETAPNKQSNGLRGIVSQGMTTNQFSTTQPSVSTSAGTLALVPQPSKDKFETKSAVWADTLSRGLVDLNISGSKTNPLSDIGIDFDAINRKEKRMEKPAANPVVSTVTMGKAMGSGTGIGRSGASALRPSTSSMMNPGTGPGFRPVSGMNDYGGITQQPMSGFGGMSQQTMDGYGSMNQPQMGGFGGMSQQPMVMGFGLGTGLRPGFGMVQGSVMQQPNGLPPGSPFNGGYNPMMGGSGYTSQQPYGGGYQ